MEPGKERIDKHMGMKIETAVAYGQSKEVGIYALASVANALAAGGVTEYEVQVRIMIPAYAYKSRIHTMEKIIKKACEGRGIVLQDICSERSNVITQSMVVVTGCGVIDKESAGHMNLQKEAQGEDIVLTKWVGMEGMLRILDEKEAELKTRFSTSFLKQMTAYKSQIFAQKEIALAYQNGVSKICQVGEGGIFAALWNLAKETESGLEVDLKKIPVIQETVEVCEFFKLNPYQLASAGAMLMIAEEGEALVNELRDQGIPAVLIGRLTDNNDKILKNGEEVRYIDRPAPDEIMKLFEE